MRLRTAALVTLMLLLGAADARGASSTPTWDRIIHGPARFKILSAFGGEAVLDKETGLVWEKAPSTDVSAWRNAVIGCANKIVGGRFGWRLPAIEELSSLGGSVAGGVRRVAAAACGAPLRERDARRRVLGDHLRSGHGRLRVPDGHRGQCRAARLRVDHVEDAEQRPGLVRARRRTGGRRHVALAAGRGRGIGGLGARRSARYPGSVNLLLLDADDFAPDGTARITGRRLAHVRTVLAPTVGSTLRAGVTGGRIGTARVAALSEQELVLDPPSLTEDPPRRAGLDLLLAVPRPKALAKLLPAVASLGIDRLVLLNAARVEKSYFTAGVLEPASIGALLRLGLEQARDTVLPEVLVRPLFRPFVEDECDVVLGDTDVRLVAHPPASEPCPRRGEARRVAIAVGPEGGWVPFEIELLGARGFRPVGIGPRVLRVETVVPLLVGLLR